MEDRIETATKLGRIPEEAGLERDGFSQWDSYSSRHDHDTILKVNNLTYVPTPILFVLLDHHYAHHCR